MADPVQVIRDLEDLTTRLDEASRTLYRKQTEFDEVTERYEDAVNDLLFGLIDEYEGKRLPGEDARNALVVKRLRDTQPELYGRYRRLRAELKREHDLVKQIERSIFGRQSILSYLKTEAQATR